MQDPAPRRGRRDRAGADQRRRTTSPSPSSTGSRTSSRPSTTSSATSPGPTPTGCTRLITEEIPAKVAADTAYQNAKKNSDKQNARIEHDKALARVMTALLKDDTELFKQFSDNESFQKWLTDTVFTATYEPGIRK